MRCSASAERASGAPLVRDRSKRGGFDRCWLGVCAIPGLRSSTTCYSAPGTQESLRSRRLLERGVDHLVERRLDVAHEQIEALDHRLLGHLRVVEDEDDELRREQLPLLNQLRAHRFHRADRIET